MSSFSLNPQVPFTERVERFIDLLHTEGEMDVAADVRRALAAYTEAEATGNGLQSLNALVRAALDADARLTSRPEAPVQAVA